MKPTNKKILFLATGGTIASIKTKHGLSPDLQSQQLLDYIPKIQQFCQVDTKQILNLDSTNMQPEHWLVIAKTIQSHYDDYDGFVIAHGTDTMAYTAAALSYLIQNSQKPIVITGSQKPIGAGITDASKNLIDSFSFCVLKDVSGVFLVFDGKVIMGTRARKVKTKSYNAFESINFPVVACIYDQKIIRYVTPCKQNEKTVQFYDKISPRVFLLKLIPGMKPTILDCIASQYDAIVIESYGTGGLPFFAERNFLDRVIKIANEGKIIVMATQVMHEGSDLSLYEVGRTVKENIPMIENYDMTLEATVTKLMWILAYTKEFDQVQSRFYQQINHDLCWSF